MTVKERLQVILKCYNEGTSGSNPHCLNQSLLNLIEQVGVLENALERIRNLEDSCCHEDSWAIASKALKEAESD
jgi:hypothetical protein